MDSLEELANSHEKMECWTLKKLVLSAGAVEDKLVDSITELPDFGGSMLAHTKNDVDKTISVTPAASPAAAAGSIIPGKPSCSKDCAKAPPPKCPSIAKKGYGFKKPTPNMEGLKEVSSAVMKAILLLSDEELHESVRVWYTLSNPIWSEHGDDWHDFKDKDVTRQHYTFLATNGHLTTLQEVFQLLKTPAVMVQLKFETDVATTLDDKHFVYLEEKRKADVCFDAAFHIFKHRAATRSHSVASLPGKFAALLHEDQAHVRRSLDWLKKLWSAICEAEVRRITSPGVASLLHNIPFASWPVVREIMLLLAQVDFSCVVKQVRLILQTCFEGFGTSLANEFAFRSMSATEQVTLNDKMSEMNKWYRLHVASVLAKFGDDEITPEPHIRALGGSVGMPSNIFACMGNASKAPTEILDGICKKQTWATYSPLSKHIIPAAVATLLHTAANGTWSQINDAWQGMFLMEKDVVRKERTKELYMVLQKTAVAVHVVPVTGKKTKRGIVWSVVLDEGPIWLPVLDYDQWIAYPYDVLPPIVAADTTPTICFACTQPSLPVIQRAAWRAFLGVPDIFLRRLMKLIGLTKSGACIEPKSVIERVMLLVQHFLPTITPTQLQEVMQLRIPTKKNESHFGSAPNDLDGVVDSSDKQEFIKHHDNIEHATFSRDVLLEKLGPGSKYVDMFSMIARPRPRRSQKQRQRLA